VIFYMGGLGIRPVMWKMGQRLADGGYLVPCPTFIIALGAIHRRCLPEYWAIRNRWKK
jgi:hypothetical protein